MAKFTKEQKRISWHNRSLARLHFFGSKQGREGWCLHHVDTTLREKDPERYIQWRIEDLVAMPNAKHTSLHKKGNQNRLGIPCTEDAKAKISLANTGKKRTEEQRQRMCETFKGEGNPHFGKHHTEETKALMSVLKKGENNPNFGNHLSVAMKEKLSAERKGMRFWNDGVVCIRAKECPDGFVAGRIKPSHK